MNYYSNAMCSKSICMAFAAAFWAALTGCMDGRSAGTSSTTGNPVKVGLGFQQDGASAAFSGRVRFYSPTHLPVFDSVPLATYELTGDSLFLTRDSVEAWIARTPDSLWLSDSLCEFNALFMSSTGRGATLMGIRYKVGKGFLKPEEWVPKGGKIDLAALTDYEGNVPSTADPQNAFFVYVQGTPFYARLEEDKFSLKGVPPGRYAPYMMRVQKSRTAANMPIESPVYGLGDTLVPGQAKTFAPGAILDTLHVPDEWWRKTFDP